MIEISRLIKSLKLGMLTIIVVTHDLEFILNCCDKIVHLESGEVKEQYKLDKIGVNRVKEFFIY